MVADLIAGIRRSERKEIPRLIYTAPKSMGRTNEEQVKATRPAYKVGTFPLASSDAGPRAMEAGQGMSEIVRPRRDEVHGRPRVGPHGGE